MESRTSASGEWRGSSTRAAIAWPSCRTATDRAPLQAAREVLTLRTYPNRTRPDITTHRTPVNEREPPAPRAASFTEVSPSPTESIARAPRHGVHHPRLCRARRLLRHRNVRGGCPRRPGLGQVTRRLAGAGGGTRTHTGLHQSPHYPDLPNRPARRRMVASSPSATSQTKPTGTTAP
jgi:hypothetical protein